MFKSAVVFAILASSPFASIAMASGLGEPAKEAQIFLAKRNPCFVWAGLNWKSTKPEPVLWYRVVCVFSGVSDEGSIREGRGCMVAMYNIRTNQYQDVLLGPSPVVLGPCTTRSALTVLEKLWDKGNPSMNIGDKIITLLGGPNENSTPWEILLGGNRKAVAAIKGRACGSSHAHIRRGFGCREPIELSGFH